MRKHFCRHLYSSCISMTSSEGRQIGAYSIGLTNTWETRLSKQEEEESSKRNLKRTTFNAGVSITIEESFIELLPRVLSVRIQSFCSIPRHCRDKEGSHRRRTRGRRWLTEPGVDTYFSSKLTNEANKLERLSLASFSDLWLVLYTCVDCK